MRLAARAASEQGLKVKFFKFDACGAEQLPDFDILCCADVLYDETLARGIARRVIEALARGREVIVTGDPDRRPRVYCETRGLHRCDSIERSTQDWAAGPFWRRCDGVTLILPSNPMSRSSCKMRVGKQNPSKSCTFEGWTKKLCTATPNFG